jgi:hypothetical protein
MKTMTVAMAIAALACAASLHAHHSVSMFDITTPIWVKGTFVRLDRMNPHVLMTLEEKKADGKVQQWRLEGPSLQGLDRMGIPSDFLKAGDLVEFCAFGLKSEYSNRAPATGGSSPQFAHGHLLVMPDGKPRLWGSYGRLENCIRPGDQTKTWVDLLNADPRARQIWCNTQLASMSRAISKELVDEINRRMANPCE